MSETVKLEPEVLRSHMRRMGITIAREFDDLVVYAFKDEIPNFEFWNDLIQAHKKRLFEILPDEGLLDENGRRLDASALRVRYEDYLSAHRPKPRRATPGLNLDLFGLEDEASKPVSAPADKAKAR